MPKRIDGTPFLVGGQSGTCVQLESVPVTRQMIDEKWLQDLVEKHPEIVPAGEIDQVFAPLVSIGREVPTRPDSSTTCSSARRLPDHRGNEAVEKSPGAAGSGRSDHRLCQEPQLFRSGRTYPPEHSARVRD